MGQRRIMMVWKKEYMDKNTMKSTDFEIIKLNSLVREKTRSVRGMSHPLSSWFTSNSKKKQFPSLFFLTIFPFKKLVYFICGLYLDEIQPTNEITRIFNVMVKIEMTSKNVSLFHLWAIFPFKKLVYFIILWAIFGRNLTHKWNNSNIQLHGQDWNDTVKM